MPSLRAQLEALADTRPADYDPEDGDNHDLQHISLYSKAAKSKEVEGHALAPRSKLRAAAQFAADLEHHPKYSGKVVPVKKLLASTENDVDDNDDSEDHSENDDEDDFNSQSSDNNEQSDEENDSQGDDEEEADEAEGSSEDDDRARPRLRATGNADIDADAELKALAAADAAAMARYHARQVEDVTRGQHVQAQAELAEGCMEARIKMQKVLTAANRLPGPQAHAALVSSDADVAAAFASARTEIHGLLDTLVSLRAALLARVPQVGQALGIGEGKQEEVEQALLPQRAGSKRKRDSSGSDPLDSAALWSAIQAGWTASAGWRDSTIDTWARRSAVASGVAARGQQLRVLGSDISTSVSAMLVDDRERLMSRARLAQGAVRHVGEKARDGEHSAGLDLETYDDAELYASLLKDYVSASAARLQANSTGAQDGEGAGGHKAGYKRSKRENVDRKASKGRKLRFIVHPKLVAFAAPTPFSVPPELAYDMDLLVASLFKG